MKNISFSEAREKLNQIKIQAPLKEPWNTYFERTASFILLVLDQYDFVSSGEILTADIAQLSKRNEALFADILSDNYHLSFADPTFAVKTLGKDFGKLFSLLYAELRNLIMYAHEKRTDLMLPRMKLFLEIHSQFTAPETPEYEEIRQIIYNYIEANLENASREKIKGLITTENDFANRIIMESDLTDLRYLYLFGEYINENIIKTAKHLNELPKETISLMADTFTEGYRKGFFVTGKDIKIKKVACIRYQLGFEQMIRQAVLNFSALGLETAFFRTNISVVEGRCFKRAGYYGAIANKQFDFDHKDDLALLLDHHLVEKRLKAVTKNYEEMKDAAKIFAGPAVLETFGELPKTPAFKEEAIRLSGTQQKLMVEYMQSAGEIANLYIPGEETSYTIIAFPCPEIGDEFPRIFDEIIAINTLDYNLYRDIQQIIIDILDQAEYVRVTGLNQNRTDIKIALHKLTDPTKQTNFENCVADVNIPVGEVFTSPKLNGTNGKVHVSRVFLSEIEYKDLEFTIEDGIITEYNCANFEADIENREFIKDNIFHNHDTLPVSEFAIGTNTKAYMVGRKYGIADRLPILIAEKLGPHFAFGDTCYSHAEDVAVFNPDGKEIVARENEISILRKTDSLKAYFNCHTDVTIPYDELGEITAITNTGKLIPLFANGTFVLPSLEELNKPLRF